MDITDHTTPMKIANAPAMVEIAGQLDRDFKDSAPDSEFEASGELGIVKLVDAGKAMSDSFSVRGSSVSYTRPLSDAEARRSL